MVALKTLIFSILVPGTVAFGIPWVSSIDDAPTRPVGILSRLMKIRPELEAD